MSMIDFQTWLLNRGVDCNEIQPELLAALQSQFEADCQRIAPITEVLVIPCDLCQWPARGYWLPATHQ